MDVGDENVNVLNVEDPSTAAAPVAAAVPTKTPRRARPATAAAQAAAAAHTASRAAAAAAAAASAHARTPLASPASSRRAAAGGDSKGSAPITSLDPRSALMELLRKAHEASKPGTQSWSSQDGLTLAIEELMEHPTCSAELPPLLGEHMGVLIAALGHCVACNHSGTQTRALKCLRLLAECPLLKRRIDTQLDVALQSLMTLVGHSSSLFLRQGVETVLHTMMRQVNASKVTAFLCRELISEKHEKNQSKVAALAGLAADGMDFLGSGFFPSAGEVAPVAPVGATAVPQLQELPKQAYRDIIRAIVRLQSQPHKSSRKAAESMCRHLVARGQENFTLTAMVRDLARTGEKNVTQAFESFVRESVGAALPSVTTGASAATASSVAAAAQAAQIFSPASNHASGHTRSASLVPQQQGGSLGALGSPLPAAARKGKNGKLAMPYAETMPKDILSPGPFAEPEYNTEGAGLLDSKDDAVLLDSSSGSLCYVYSPETAAARASMAMQPASSGDAATAAIDEPVQRQLFVDLGVSILEDAEADLQSTTIHPAAVREEEDDNIVVLAQSSPAHTAVGVASPGCNDSGRTWNYSRASMLEGSVNASMCGASLAAAATQAPVALSLQTRGSLARLAASNAAAAASAASPAAVAGRASTRSSSGHKRKASAVETPGAGEYAAADDGAAAAAAAVPSNVASLTPKSKLRVLQSMTHELKRHKSAAACAAPTPAALASASSTLSAAVALAADVQASHVARMSARNAEQKSWWASRIADTLSKRAERLPIATPPRA